MSFVPASVKTFTSTTKRIQTPDGRSSIEKPKVSLDDQINDWAKENQVVIISTAVTGFSVLERGPGDAAVRRTVCISQVVYLPEAAYFERESRIRAGAMGTTCGCHDAPVASVDAEPADTDAGGPDDLRIPAAPQTEDEDFAP